LSYPTNSLTPPLNTIRTIILWLKYGVDIDEYLPKETLDWCIQQLSMHNIDLGGLSGSSTISGGLRAHTQAGFLTIRRMAIRKPYGLAIWFTPYMVIWFRMAIRPFKNCLRQP
jgi:hypothetical protein